MSRCVAAVTGMGALAAVGEGVRAFWDGLRGGRSGARPVRGFDTRGYRTRIAYELAHPGGPLDESGRGRTAALLLRASREAVGSARLTRDTYPPARVAVVVGSALAELRAAEVMLSARRVHPSYLRHLSLSAEVAREVGACGPHHTLTNACASGSFATALGADLLLAGEADCVIACGADTITESMYGQADRVNPRAPTCVAPFSARRQGVLLGEGAGALVLERPADAARRAAPIRGYIAGYAMGCDAYRITAMDEERVAEVIRQCLADAGLLPGDIDYVCAHGTGTPMNDAVEAQALVRALGARASQIPVSAIKSMIGHTSGASGTLGLIATLLAMAEGVVPPTINLDERDPAIPLNCVPNRAQPWRVRTALVNAFGFGGTNCCIVVRSAGGER